MKRKSIIEIKEFKIKGNVLLKETKISIKEKSWTCLLGASGCGKTSLLKYISGINSNISFNGSITGFIDEKKCMYMDQKPGLLPWRNILSNIGISSLLYGEEIDIKKIEIILESLSLNKSIKNKYPEELSLGMQQRVSLARTIYMNRDIILLDEPFSALDAITKKESQDFTKNNLSEKTVILVTHDIIEAMILSNTIYVFRPSTMSFEGPFEINEDNKIKKDIEYIMDNKRDIYKKLISIING